MKDRKNEKSGFAAAELSDADDAAQAGTGEGTPLVGPGDVKAGRDGDGEGDTGCSHTP